MQASLPSFSVISFITSNFNSPVRIILLFVFIYMSNCISFILFVFRFLERRQNLPDLVGSQVDSNIQPHLEVMGFNLVRFLFLLLLPLQFSLEDRTITFYNPKVALASTPPDSGEGKVYNPYQPRRAMI